MSPLPGLLRVAKVLTAYAVLGGLLWAWIPAIQRTFLLPVLFGTVARSALALGALLAAAVAWRYPRVGRQDPTTPRPPETRP